MLLRLHRLAIRLSPLAALVLLLIAMDGTWSIASPANAAPLTAPAASAPATPVVADGGAGERRGRGSKSSLRGTVNLNTATPEELEQLPTVGPAKAEAIVLWRKKHGPFRRPADIRRVKGFGYKTFKRLAPYLAIQGASTLAPT